MTKLNDVVQRAISDAAFRSQLRSDPAKALRGFSLSPEETQALTSGDPAKLVALGIDQRMSKVFVTGGASGAPFDTHTGGDVGPSHAVLTSTGGRLAGGQTANSGDPDAILISGRDERDALAAPHYRNDPDYVASGGDSATGAYLHGPDRIQGDPDFVAPTSGQVDSGATIDPGSVDSASLQTGENQVDTGAQVDSTDAAHNTITPGGDHVTDY
ncbi:MAG: hypothetical protein AUG02_00425 [Chloroflexi bacterium 13_1_20CM_2_70_9]|nr:MAG: hypothetical protein AUG02_00425 [Chloroflexi bacterium 13_1_20CM_2_70_9]